MDKLAELQTRRKTLAATIGELRTKHKAAGDKWADEAERGQWDKVNADYDACVREIEELKTMIQVGRRADEVAATEERELHQPNPKTRRLPGMEDSPRHQTGEADAPPTQEERARAMSAFCRAQFGGHLSDEDLDIMQRCRLSPWQRELVINTHPGQHSQALRKLSGEIRNTHPTRRQSAAEARNLSAISFGSGGALVPETFLSQLEVNMVYFGGMREVAETLVTSAGDRMTWPTGDDTSNTGEQLGENASNGSSVDPSFGAVAWDAYKFSSKPVLVPFELLEDAFLDFASLLGQMLGERLGRITNTKFTTGSGANTPKGIITAASSGYTAASATAIVYDEVIRLKHSVDPAYRNGAGFMCHDNVVLALRLLKDGNGRYLWESGAFGGSADTLDSNPLTVNQDMASSIIASAKTLLFGQLSKYKIRRVNSIRMYRLQERYRDTDQDGFIALLREDGNLLHAGTVPVKYLTQHA